ncbi:MAG: ATP--guanido phosphotransferase [Oscillospiraceae bacterium]|nr:ATP--guanido phosphotransferase [Oscillospiraceae bacterium]
MIPAWLEREGPMGGIALSSRVRLARNLANIPFPDNTSNRGYQWIDHISGALTRAGGGSVFFMEKPASAAERQSLVEQYAISHGFASLERPAALIRTADGGISVMVGEEDHIRLQAFASGLDLKSCLDEAMRVDDLLDGQLDYAFSETLGFLTACPTNLGTGMRASVMLHLHALTKTGALRGVIQSAAQMGFTVRGLYGEGSKALGGLYQLSNQSGFGIGENELIERMTEATKQIIASESASRELMRRQYGPRVSDMIHRAYGLLSHARLIGLDEAMEQLGVIRAGVSMGEITGVSFTALNRLLVDIQSATLMLYHGASKNDIDAKRAGVIRAALGPNK